MQTQRQDAIDVLGDEFAELVDELEAACAEAITGKAQLATRSGAPATRSAPSAPRRLVLKAGDWWAGLVLEGICLTTSG